MQLMKLSLIWCCPPIGKEFCLVKSGSLFQVCSSLSDSGLFRQAGCPVFQLTSESELSSQQQNRLNEVIRAITQVHRHILLLMQPQCIRVTLHSVKIKCNCTELSSALYVHLSADHHILRSHWFAVQQCLFGGSFAFGPYVHQSQSHRRQVQQLRMETPSCCVCDVFVFLLLSCHPLSSSGFQLPLREKCHQIHHRLPEGGGKKRFADWLLSFFNFNHITNLNY